MYGLTERLSGTVVLLTGGTGGLGIPIAERLATEGAVLAVTDLDVDMCHRVVDILPGGQISTRPWLSTSRPKRRGPPWWWRSSDASAGWVRSSTMPRWGTSHRSSRSPLSDGTA